MQDAAAAAPRPAHLVVFAKVELGVSQPLERLHVDLLATAALSASAAAAAPLSVEECERADIVPAGQELLQIRNLLLAIFRGLRRGWRCGVGWG
jgi:hypothetical protein